MRCYTIQAGLQKKKDSLRQVLLELTRHSPLGQINKIEKFVRRIPYKNFFGESSICCGISSILHPNWEVPGELLRFTWVCWCLWDRVVSDFHLRSLKSERAAGAVPASVEWRKITVRMACIFRVWWAKDAKISPGAR